MQIGILALQGAFAEHGAILDQLGVDHFEIRNREHLHLPFDGLIIPGGESTVIGKLLTELQMMEPIKQEIEHGLPVFGTCAGLLLLSKKIEGENALGFGTMDILARRNAYGRQLGSFFTKNEFKGIGKIPMTFIRAPYIVQTSDNVEVLAVADSKIVAAKQDNQLVTAFHPELTSDTRIHNFFVQMIETS